MEAVQVNSNMNEFFNSETFKKIESKIISEAVSEANKSARKELELFKFELTYPQIVPKSERDEIEKQISQIRDKKWKAALKKANGNEEKALELL